MLGRMLGLGTRTGDISVEDARTRQDRGALLIDVREAVDALKQAGYDRAVNVSGGMVAWSRANLPLART